MLGSNTLGLLVTIFIILNIASTIIIVSACIVSGRASRSIDPSVEAQMLSQRELAIAVSKLRVISPDPVPAGLGGHNLFFSPAEQVDVVEQSETHTGVEAAIAT